MDLETVVSELYGLLPEEFAGARKIRAGEAQGEGRRDLAAAIRQLRRPTASAWLANLLVRERETEVSELLAFGIAMQRAQAGLAGAEMRRLSQQRHDVVATLSGAARELARDHGKEASESTIRELEETLDAAIADPDAREALASGHLATAMHYSGLGSLGLGRLAAGSTAKAPRAAARPSTVGPTTRRRAETATARAEEAEGEVTEYVRTREAALEEVERCNRAIAEAQDLLRSLRSERERAHVELRKAERALTASQRKRSDTHKR